MDDLKQSDTPDTHDIAYIYAFWGDKDMAFEWLDRAYEEHDPDLIQVRSKRGFQILHNDPRWEALLQKLGLSDEHAEKLGL